MVSPFVDEQIALFELLKVYPAKQQIQIHLSQRFSPELAVMWMRYAEIKSNIGRRSVLITPFDYDPELGRGYESTVDWCAEMFPHAEKSYFDFCQARGIDPEEVEMVIREFAEDQIADNRVLTQT